VTLVLAAASCYGPAQYTVSSPGEMKSLDSAAFVLGDATHATSEPSACTPPHPPGAALCRLRPRIQQGCRGPGAGHGQSAHHSLPLSSCMPKGEHVLYSQTLAAGNGSTPATPLRQKGRLLGSDYVESGLVLARPSQLHDMLAA